jgi:hypothetical protein
VTRCLRAKVPESVISDVTGIKTVQVIRDHYDDLGLDDARAALASLPILNFDSHS